MFIYNYLKKQNVFLSRYSVFLSPKAPTQYNLLLKHKKLKLFLSTNSSFSN